MVSRRQFMVGGSMAVVAAGLSVGRARADASVADDLAAALRRIEAGTGGRLGVAVLDKETGLQAGHRADERFPMCSTFKVLAAGAILARIDAGTDQLDRRIPIDAEDLVTYSPITQARVGGDMSLAEVCAAGITQSDNTAGNLMLRAIGGPAGLTGFVRSIGDPITRLDRVETDLNEALPDDPRDTTTPAAMVATLDRLAFGTILSMRAREQLCAWMKATRTGDTRLRAGVPKEWVVGDKTGAGDRGTTNDIAVLWPPKREPVLIAVYLTGATVASDDRNAAVAAVGRAVAAAQA